MSIGTIPYHVYINSAHAYCKTIRLQIHTLFLSVSHSPPSSRLYLVVTTSNVVMTSYAQVHDTTFTHNVQLTQYCLTSDLHFLLYRREDQDDVTFRMLKVNLNDLLHSILFVIIRGATSKYQ